MAVKPMPVPSLNEGVYMPKKKQKQPQTSTAVTNTATLPPQPAQEVGRTTGTAYSTSSTVSAPKQKQIYEQTVPKPKEYNAAQNFKTIGGYNTSKQSSSYSEKVSSYNPLTLNQNKTAAAGAYGSTKQRTVTYDAVPTPQTQYGSVKPQQTKSYSYTEPKPKANQYVSNTADTAKSYTDNISSAYTYSTPKVYTGEYKTSGGYTNENPYTSKDRVADYGKNGYPVFPKPQVKNNYADVKGQNDVNRCGQNIMHGFII